MIRYALLTQYRVLAFTTATLLIVLVFAGIPLQVAAGDPQVVNVVGTIHGFLYLVYLVVAFRITYRLKVPIWQMLLVLLAGTVPFAAFVAERKISERFATFTGGQRKAGDNSPAHQRSKSASAPKRWLSKRAVLLHFEVLIVAPGCAIAGWWQATRALAGNSLSWVYSVEWPIFALLAIWGWWHLLHEDPDAYRLRRMQTDDRPTGATPDSASSHFIDSADDLIAARFARYLAVAVGTEFVIGFVTLAFVPLDRANGLIPVRDQAIYLVHAIFGTILIFAAALLVLRARPCVRPVRLCAAFGLSGLLLAGIGGVMTEAGSLVRFAGMAFMLVGPAFSAFAYMVPTLPRSSSRVSA